MYCWWARSVSAEMSLAETTSHNAVVHVVLIDQVQVLAVGVVQRDLPVELRQAPPYFGDPFVDPLLSEERRDLVLLPASDGGLPVRLDLFGRRDGCLEIVQLIDG